MRHRVGCVYAVYKCIYVCLVYVRMCTYMHVYIYNIYTYGCIDCKDV